MSVADLENRLTRVETLVERIDANVERLVSGSTQSSQEIVVLQKDVEDLIKREESRDEEWRALRGKVLGALVVSVVLAAGSLAWAGFRQGLG